MKRKIKRKAGRWYVGYKCVYTVGRQLMSYGNGGWVVGYAIGRKTVRPRHCGALAVFKDLTSAQNFDGTCGLGDTCIYKCRYKRSATRRMYVSTLNGRRYAFIGRTLRGTDYADAVVLLERVK